MVASLHENLPVTEETWQRAHRELSRLAKEQAQRDFEVGRWLVAAHQSKAHTKLGFASFVEYVCRLFGCSPRVAQEKIRVAAALEGLPELSLALSEGTVNWSTVRELSRVADKATEGEWLRAAHNRTVQEVQRDVSGRKLGDRPTDRPRPELRKHIIHLEVSGETTALWREGMMMMQKQAGTALSEEEVLRLLLRAALGGPEDAGRASHQIVISRCPDCDRVTQRGRGEDFEVSHTTLEQAECDAQRIDLRPAEHGVVPHATQDIPPAVRRLVMLRDRGHCVVPGCKHAAYLNLHHLNLRSEGGTHDPDLLVTLCDVHHTHVHEGRLLISGSVSAGLSFRHADGTRYGGTLIPEVASAMSDAFAVLVELGFKQGESKRALDFVRAHVGANENSTALDGPAMVKAALRHLRGA